MSETQDINTDLGYQALQRISKYLSRPRAAVIDPTHDRLVADIRLAKGLYRDAAAEIERLTVENRRLAKIEDAVRAMMNAKTSAKELEAEIELVVRCGLIAGCEMRHDGKITCTDRAALASATPASEGDGAKGEGDA